MLNEVAAGLKRWLISLPYSLLLVMAAFMALAPFQPEPHLVQKFNWWVSGTAFKAIDVFDVVWHLLPFILIAIKWVLTHSKTPAGH